MATTNEKVPVEDRLSSLEAKFSEFLEWYKAVNFTALRAALESALPNTTKRVAYELSTADRTTDEVARLAVQAGVEKLAGRTVAGWQAEWVRLGLMRQVTARKREKIFSLPDFGIEVGADLSKLNGKGGTTGVEE